MRDRYRETYQKGGTDRERDISKGRNRYRETYIKREGQI
jgi:hypothetical protein